LPRAIQRAAAGTRIVGRETEFQALGAAWEAALCRRQQLALVSGDEGIGKTSVAFAFAQSVSPNATVLLGRCSKEASLLRLLSRFWTGSFSRGLEQLYANGWPKLKTAAA
jgi:predicted ATPase